MSEHGLFYTENDMEKFVHNRRFLAAVHGYSMGLIPLGEAIVRAAEAKPYYPRTLEIVGYVQLFHEVAERIHDGRFPIPDGLRQEYRDIYDQQEPKDPVEVRFFSARDFMKFAELRQPEVKKKMFNLFRREYNEEDIRELTKDRKLLAAIDAYGRNLIGLWEVKESAFGDFNANPRDLNFQAFKLLCFEVVDRIRAGLIQIPPDLEMEFADIYHQRSRR